MAANRTSRIAGITPLTFQLDGLWRWATSREMAGRWVLLAVAVAIFGVQVPVLGMYFISDDFVPLGDIEASGAWTYIGHLFLLDDPTPNWRFLTGLVYLALYQTFGLNAAAFLLTSLITHIATAALIFRFVRRHTDSLGAAATGAALFGVSAAYVPTVAYATAFTHLLGTFLIIAALVTIDEAFDSEHRYLLSAASVGLFALAVMANEPVSVLAPIYGIVVFLRIARLKKRSAQMWAFGGLLSLAYIAIGVAAITSLAVCNCTAADDLTGPGGHIFGNIWIYLGRLIYPIGLEWPGEASLAHIVGGAVVMALMVGALVRGPDAARVASVLLALTLIPYLPVDWILAPRYVYLAAAPFSILGALLAFDLAKQLKRVSPVMPAFVGVAVLSAVGLLAWQTWDQNNVMAEDSERWRTLVSGLEQQYPDVPEGSRVYVRGGPLSAELLQQEIIPAIGKVLWEDVQLVTVEERARMLCSAPAAGTYVLDFNDGTFGELIGGRGPSEDLIVNDPRAGGVPPLIVDCKDGTPP